MKNIGILKEGLNRLLKNPVLLVPFLMQVIIVYVIQSLMSGQSPSASAGFIALLIVYILLLIFLNTFFYTAIFRMLNTPKPKFKDIFNFRFFGRMLLVSLLLALIIIGATIVFYLIVLLFIAIGALLYSIVGAIIVTVVIIALGVIALIMLYSLFILPPFYLVIKNSSATKAISGGIKTAWKNYFKLLGLVSVLAIPYIIVFGILISRVALAILSGTTPEQLSSGTNIIISLIFVPITAYTLACLNRFTADKAK
jgi:hypothetical protein